MTKKVREYRLLLKCLTLALLILQLRMLKSTSPCLHYYLYGVVDFKTLTWSINEATVIACLYEKSRNKNVSSPNVYEFAKNKLEPFIKQQRQAMNPEEVRHFKEERARLFKEWDGALNNTRKGSNRDRQGRFQNGSTPPSSSADERIPTETVSNRPPTAADCL